MSKLVEKSIWVLNAGRVDCPDIQYTSPGPPPSSTVLQYHTATDGDTVTVVAVPNAFVYIDVNNDVSSLAFNVTADVSAMTLGDKVFICFRYSSLDVNNVVTATILSPIIMNPPDSFTVVNVTQTPDKFNTVLVAMPRFLLDLTFYSHNLMFTYEIY